MTKIQLLFFLLMTLFACQPEKPDRWEMAIPVIGSNSSPKATDLNQDGILDIVVGAGRNEFQASKYALMVPAEILYGLILASTKFMVVRYFWIFLKTGLMMFLWLAETNNYMP